METTCRRLLLELRKYGSKWEKLMKQRRACFLKSNECVDVYRKKVDRAYQCRAQLCQAIADSKSELAKFYSTLGIHPMHIIQSDQKAANLKEELKERSNLLDILEHINNISIELYSSPREAFHLQRVEPHDLSLKSLDSLHVQLDALQKEKSDRLKKIMDYLNSLSSLCLVLIINFKDKIREIHPTLDDYKGTRTIDNGTIQKLSATVANLKEVKIQRLKLQKFAVTLLELWNLMDTPPEEQHRFQNITSKIIDFVVANPFCLSEVLLHESSHEIHMQAETEVLRRKSELEENYRKSHMVIDVWGAAQYSAEAIDSVQKRFFKELTNGKQHAKRKAGLKNTIGMVIAKMLEEVHILSLSVQRKLRLYVKANSPGN
ncbi:hypothetical protein V2J09_021261 [Rumex salicifolius]